ncbi:voltage-gated potassium channel [Rickenella mellea]|uniref:Voltage-gated potassium channel n=1 Tax=Rickenella mellea TaxID=50990 RepID=A0A4Y7QMP6_9AGAM|nr:voltage-gated potassium channel [Rickenella mellea]
MSLPTLKNIRALASISPLLAAVIAPLSTLMDIPALTEHWYDYKDGTGRPDPRTNIYLSAIGLAFNVLANGLLIIRFSASDHFWATATRMSVLCWAIKVVVAIVNVSVYGSRLDPAVVYGEGFCCAVVSLIISGLILCLLMLHFVFGFRNPREPPTPKQLQLRMAGRQFMLQNTFFIAWMGILALFMSQLEGWTYLQGIYFASVTFLTIGFGDFYPTLTVTKIVLFPFALVGIAQLGNIIGIIASFFSAQAQAREDARRAEFEKERQAEEELKQDAPNLKREIEFLESLTKLEDRWKTVTSLGKNILGFLVFWSIGALIFSQTEGWKYGEGLYFTYVSFLVIGYGDIAPVSNAGRVIFVVYALIAVPIVTGFAVETVTAVFRKVSDSRMRDRRAELGIDTGVGTDENPMEDPVLPDHSPSSDSHPDSEKALSRNARRKLVQDQKDHWIVPHEHFVARGHERIEQKVARSPKSEGQIEEEEIDEDKILTEYILELAIEVERHARRLLVSHMGDGTSGQILLKADRNVQLRDMQALAKEAEQSDGAGNGLTGVVKKFMDEEGGLGPGPHKMEEQETMREVMMYREAFASLLAAGSRLMKLKGEEQYLFERRQARQDGP